MCGLCGEFRFDGKSVDTNTLQRMLVPLQSRGPDNEGIYQSKAIGLGHRRLSIIDLSAKANQPMQDSATKLTIVFNGTIYNYPQLREQLIQKGHSFTSTGDTEVILKAYAQWGRDCVAKLVGMFAFAIWDDDKQDESVAPGRVVITRTVFRPVASLFLLTKDTRGLLGSGDVSIN